MGGIGFSYPRRVLSTNFVQTIAANQRALESWIEGHVLSLEEDGTLIADDVVEPWTEIASPYLNSWVEFDAASTVRYRKDPWGIVHLEGLVKTGTLNTQITSLPAAYQPDRTLHIASIDSAGSCRIRITDTGAVTQLDGTSTTWVSLNNIHFFAG